jgi:hypothetical protein
MWWSRSHHPARHGRLVLAVAGGVVGYLPIRNSQKMVWAYQGTDGFVSTTEYTSLYGFRDWVRANDAYRAEENDV